MSMSAWMYKLNQQFTGWWVRPTTRRDRAGGAVFGGLGSLLVGVVGRLTIGPLPLPVTTLVFCAVTSLSVGVLLGIAFPKYLIVLCYPFVLLLAAILDGI